MAKDKDYHKKYREDYDKKVKYITISVPATLYDELEKLSELEQTKVSTLFKNMGLAYLQQKTLIPKDYLEALREHTLLIRNIANNINQIAHHSNTLKLMTQDDEHSLLMELKKLEDRVKEYTHEKVKAKN
jgi:metal-responsive CopG/Arc/MetJ family transcriptional regulator